MPADFAIEQLVFLGNRERGGGETQENLQSMKEGGQRVCVWVGGERERGEGDVCDGCTSVVSSGWSIPLVCGLCLWRQPVKSVPE